MPCIISEAQAGFIPWRKIADNIILARELVKAYSRKHISPRCMMKVDMMKAYDSVEWVYLEQLLEYLCFPTKFINWVRTCVSTVSYSIMINGELTKPFEAAKGLRQANPNKRAIYFGGVAQDTRQEILQNTGYSLGELPFKYLGIPLDTKKITALQWQPLIDK
ncbi:PREDICTED: uncharacterized protein LOC109232542 [Nicotiana attenuata]|uniref:uncharacterized protein LOC109232542 n=1 Tax=Nicotiana attenuata TaxID=49451 RepID=UPI000904A83E|nr:PREDICTED: uncharacterized protein LOC109232542 [Nicotiana attenuata]